MTRLLQTFAVAAMLATGPGAAQAAYLTFDYTLAPGDLTFTIDDTALTSAGFGTVSPAAGLLGLTLTIGGQSYDAASDAFFSSQPTLTLVNTALNFLAFSPVAGGTQFDFFASANGTPGQIDYSFDGVDGTGTLTSTTVPEPATFAVLASGLLGLMAVRRRS